MTDEDLVLLEPFRYLRSQPGKEIRSHLIEAFQHWINVPPDLLDPIKSCVEMLHNASLLYVARVYIRQLPILIAVLKF